MRSDACVVWLWRLATLILVLVLLYQDYLILRYAPAPFLGGDSFVITTLQH